MEIDALDYEAMEADLEKYEKKLEFAQAELAQALEELGHYRHAMRDAKKLAVAMQLRDTDSHVAVAAAFASVVGSMEYYLLSKGIRVDD